MKNWTVCPLAEVVTGVQTGTTPPTKEPAYFNGDIDWYTPSDIGNSKNLLVASRRITAKAVEEGKAKVLQRGTLLVTCIGEIGRVGILRRESSSNQQITALNFNDEIDSDFAYYWFLFNKPRIERNANQALVPILNNERLLDCSIYYPPLSKQKQIVKVLDQADRLRRIRRYVLEMSDSFLPAVFVEMFGDLKETAASYEQVAFGDMVDSNQLGLVRGAVEMNNSYPYEYLRMDSIIGDGTLDLNKLKRVEATDTEVRSFSLQFGDFLFNTRNSKELVGKTALYTQRHGVRLFNNNIMRIRFKSMLTPEFMIGLFQSPWLKQNLERIKSGTTSVFAIYYKDLADIPIIVPSLSLQKKFVDVFTKQERFNYVQAESLRQAEHLFQSLLHQAFSEN